MHKTLFWVQNETPTTPNKIGIDGDIFDYEPKPYLNKAVATIMDNTLINSPKKELFKRICNKYDIPANFILSWNNKHELLIQSVFQNLDETGTPQTFRFRCNTIDPKIVCETLEMYAKLIGKTLRKNELENISNIINEIHKTMHKIFLRY